MKKTMSFLMGVVSFLMITSTATAQKQQPTDALGILQSQPCQLNDYEKSVKNFFQDIKPNKCFQVEIDANLIDTSWIIFQGIRTNSCDDPHVIQTLRSRISADTLHVYRSPTGTHPVSYALTAANVQDHILSYLTKMDMIKEAKVEDVGLLADILTRIAIFDMASGKRFSYTFNASGKIEQKPCIAICK